VGGGWAGHGSRPGAACFGEAARQPYMGKSQKKRNFTTVFIAVALGSPLRRKRIQKKTTFQKNSQPNSSVLETATSKRSRILTEIAPKIYANRNLPSFFIGVALGHLFRGPRSRFLGKKGIYFT
jgi:hypothetical protein